MRFPLALVLLLSAQAFASAIEPASSSTSVRGDASSKTALLEVNPVSFIVGVYGAQLSFGVGDSVTLGPTLSILDVHFFDNKYKGSSFGAQATFYMTGTRFTHSWIISPFVSQTSYDLHYVPMFSGLFTGKPDPDRSAHVRGTVWGAVTGYQWNWQGGFSLTVGGGFAYWTTPDQQTVTAADGTTATARDDFAGLHPIMATNVGWAF